MEVSPPQGATIAQAVADLLPFAPTAAKRLFVRVSGLYELPKTKREQRNAVPSAWAGGECGGEQARGVERTYDVLQER